MFRNLSVILGAVLTMMTHSSRADGMDIVIYGKHDAPIKAGSVAVSYPQNLLDTTLVFLSSANTPYKQGKGYLSEIDGLGGYKQELRNGITRYYGWCYSLADQIVNKGASEINATPLRG